MENPVVKGFNGFSDPETGIVTGHNILSGCGNPVVNPAMPFPVTDTSSLMVPMDPANLASPVVSDNNALFKFGNRIEGLVTDLSLLK